MASNETTAKFNVDISGLKKGIQDANRQIKLANAEFKAASSAMTDWQKTTEGVSAKITQLDKNLKSQNAILDAYKKELALIVAEQGEESKGADEMRIKIANQQAVVNKTSQELDKYKGILDQLEAEQEQATKSAQNQSTAYDTLRSTIEKQESDLEALKKQYASVVLEEGKNSDSAKTLASQIDKLSTELNDNKQKMQEADKAANSLDKSIDSAGEDAKESTEGFTVLKGALADLASNAIQAVIKALKDMATAAADAWQEFDNGRDTIVKLTGATGEQADAMMKSYENVSKSVVSDFNTIGTAIGETSTRFGIAGDDLDQLSIQFLKFAQVNNTDVKTSIDNVQKALSAYGKDASYAGGFLDTLTNTAQSTGVGVDQLTSGLVSNGAAFMEMGLSIEQSVEFMGMLEKSGANSETVLNGMRKALKNSSQDGADLTVSLIRLQNAIENGADGMDGLTMSYELFGKSGDQIYGAIKSGSLSFRDLSKAATDASGTLERTFADTLDPVDSVRLKVQSLRFEVAQSMDKFLKEHGPQIEKFLDDFIQNILPALVSALEGIGDFLGWIIDNGETIVGILTGVGTAIGVVVGYNTALAIMNGTWAALPMILKGVAAAQGVLNAVMAANPIVLIVGLIAGLVAAFIYFWNTSEEFRQFWIDLWNGIKETASKAWAAIKQFFADAWDAVTAKWNKAKEFFEGVWAAIKAPFEKAGEWFKENVSGPIQQGFKEKWENVKQHANDAWIKTKEAWSAAKGWFETNVQKPVDKGFNDSRSGLWTRLVSGAQGAWDGIKKAFSQVGSYMVKTFGSAWQSVKELFSSGGSIFNDLKDSVYQGFKTALNKVIDGLNTVIGAPFEAINKLLDKMASVQIAGQYPLKGLASNKLNIPKIPYLASGGVLERGQVGILEGNGAEAIVPLENNRKWIAATARDLKKALVAEGVINISGVGGAGGVTNNYNFVQNNNSPKALDRLSIYRDTNSLLFDAKVRLSNV